MRLISAQQDVAMLEGVGGAVVSWIEPQATTIASSFIVVFYHAMAQLLWVHQSMPTLSSDSYTLEESC